MTGASRVARGHVPLKLLQLPTAANHVHFVSSHASLLYLNDKSYILSMFSAHACLS